MNLATLADETYGLTLMDTSAILGTRAVMLRRFAPDAALEPIERYRI